MNIIDKYQSSVFKRLGIIFFALILSIVASSQEICDNAIDDDGDGLIDLNDIADCQCDTTVFSIPSLIPNPSFEAMNCCPTSWSQMNCAQDWIQASDATSDYYNTCGYVPGVATAAGLVPFPDGNGIVGTIYTNGWQEYVGSCLLQPMLAGQPYTIQMQIASTPDNGFGEECNGGVINYGPVDVTIYGNTSCANLPFVGSDCPSGSWQVLGSTNYTPVSSWGTISITFTPPVDMDAIVIGSPCPLPAGYDWNGAGGCDPYFYYDNLLLNVASLFNSVSQTGSWCTNDIQLTILSIPGGTYQWYLDGIALLSETDLTLDVSAGGYGVGNYSIVSSDSNTCAVATDSVVPLALPTVDFSAPGVCFGFPTVFTDNSTVVSASITAWQWDFGDGSLVDNNQNPLHVYQSSGNFNVTLIVTSDSGCTDTLVQPVVVYPLPTANFIASKVCRGMPTNFTDLSYSNIVSWNWNFGDGNSDTVNQNPTHIYANDGNYNATLTVKDGNGCSQSITNQLFFTPSPIADFSIEPQSTTILTPAVTFTNTSFGADSSYWDFGDGTSYLGFETAHTYADTGTYAVWLIITDSLGCLDSIIHYVTIAIESDFILFAPSAFTPDKDRKNDVFIPKGIGIDVNNFEMYIYDRWGDLIYESQDINMPWDGKVNNGSEIAQQDVYIWLVYTKDYLGKRHQYVGRVTLIR